MTDTTITPVFTFYRKSCCLFKIENNSNSRDCLSLITGGLVQWRRRERERERCIAMVYMYVYVLIHVHVNDIRIYPTMHSDVMHKLPKFMYNTFLNLNIVQK